MSTASNCGAKGKRDGRVLVSKGCLLLRGRRIGRGGHRCRRPVKNSMYSHPPSPISTTTVTLSILIRAQLTEQINMSFVLVVCCVL